MLKIKIAEIFRHRNETTFRPYINARHLFRDIGIQFVFEGNDYDLTWVGQASFSDKKHPLDRSISRGLWFLENQVKGDYVLFDGNDSASLMGTWDVFKQSNAKLMLKNTLYSDPDNYSVPSPHGRIYWEKSGLDYSLSKKDLKSKQFKEIQLSGANWLSTVQPNWLKYKDAKKDIDVCAMFSFPAKENKEFEVQTNQYYDAHREKCINELKKLPPSIKVAMLENGQRVPIEEYYNIMSRSKIIIAPFGYGEIAPRDIESAMVGAILIKPDMGHISTIPNIYIPDQTFINVNWNFDDLTNKILTILQFWSEFQEKMVEGMRKEYAEKYNQTNLVIKTHEWISKLPGFGTE